MNFEAWLTIFITVVIFAAMIFNVPADLLFIGAAAVLTIAGVITPSEALSGFSNSAVVTVGALYVVAAGLRETGVLDYLAQRLLGTVKSEFSALRRLSGILIPMSALMNNTPIVAMFTPIVLDWCRRNRVSPSKLLIPVSYLTILGARAR